MSSSNDFFAHIDRLTQACPYPTRLEELPERERAQILLDFQEDYQRYYFGNSPITVKKVTDFPGLLATFFYRVSRHLFLRKQEEKALQASNAGRYLTHMELYYSADIGSGLKINHGLGLVIGARVRIGKQALLHHNITLGAKDGGSPMVGNKVTIYPGAMVLGSVTIGNGTTIGANSLVLNTFPNDSLLVGTPAQNLRHD